MSGAYLSRGPKKLPKSTQKQTSHFADVGLRAFGSEHGLDSSMVLGREGIRLGAEPLTLDLEHHDLASEGLEFVGFRLLCEVQGGCGLVDEVDSLVWEEVFRDVPCGVDGSSDEHAI